METSAVAGHLEQRYGIEVARVVLIESVYRVDLRDGSGWIARVFPVDRPIETVVGDAEVLRFVEAHGFPAERCADAEPVSMLDGHGVLVTRFVSGADGRGDTSPELFLALGDLLGWLHTLPEAGGAMARPAGSWHHLVVAGGGRDEDVAALRPQLVGAEFAPLRDELEQIDLLDDLPLALHHPDFATPNAIVTADGPVLIDWTSAGRGARISSLGTLLSCTESDVGLVDCIVEGYRKHVQLEAEELDRLGGAIRAFGVVLDCWMGMTYSALLPQVVQGLAAKREAAEVMASRARAAFRAA